MKSKIKDRNLSYVFVSHATQKLIQPFVPDAVKRGSVIYTGVGVDDIYPEKIKMPDPGTYIINVGTIDPRKNQMMLADLAYQLKSRGIEIDFVIVGQEDKNELKKILSRIEEKQVAHLFRFLGPRNRQTTYNLIKNANLYFHTSHTESFGRTLVEAMGLGTPVLSMEYDAVHEILGGCENAIISQSEPIKNIADKITSYIKNDKERDNLSSLQSKIYNQKFRLSKMVTEYVDLLNNVKSPPDSIPK